MIITVTPNTALDQTLFVPEFRLNATLRAGQVALGMGGKAADAAWILGQWGIPSLALGFAAGALGQRMEQMLQARGVETDFIWVQGETRLNTLIVCTDGSGQSTISVSTLDVTPEQVEALCQKFQAELPRATCVILGGSLPRGVPQSLFPELIGMARDAHVPVVLDSSGAALRAGLAVHPMLIKPNRAELEELCGEKATSRDDVYRLAYGVQRKYQVDLIVTLGAEGAYALVGRAHYWVPPIPVDVVSTAGAGDAVLAGMAAAYASGRPIEDGLRLGFALATAVLLTPATAEFRRTDAERFLDQVCLEKMG
jgi:1-phosphofructokinase family hexose kinase